MREECNVWEWGSAQVEKLYELDLPPPITPAQEILARSLGAGINALEYPLSGFDLELEDIPPSVARKRNLPFVLVIFIVY